MEDYVRARHIEEGFDYVGTPHITKEGLFHTSGHLPYYKDTMFPPMEMEGSDYYLKAMNCPMHNLIYRSRGRSYRRAAAAAVRVRSVYRYEKSGVDPRPDPGARLHPGRLALLLHQGAGAGARSSTCSASCSACCATSASTTSTWSCRPATTPSRTSSSAPTRTGRRPPPCWSSARWRPGWSWCRTRAARRSTARRSPCRPRTRSAAPGRCRPSSTTSTSRRASGWSTRPPTAPGSSR